MLGKFGVVAALAVVSILVVVEPAYANSFIEIEAFFKKILVGLTGPLARTVGAIAIAALGYMAFRGRVPWERAISIIIGLFLIFGGAGFIEGGFG